MVGNRLEKLARIKTNLTGIYYREIITNEKKDKVYYVIYKDNNKKTVELKIGKFSEGIREAYCNKIRNEIITKLRLGEEPPASARNKKRKINSLKTIAEQYFDQRLQNSTTKSDRAIFEYYISPHFEDIDFIDKDTLLQWNKYLISAKQKNNNKKFISPKYQNDIKTLLISIGRYAIKNDLTKNDFMKYIQKISIDNARERFLTIDEINALYQYFEHDHFDFIFVKLALNTGARLSSLLNIQKKDLDFAHKLITLKDIKNNSTYKNFLTDELILLLKDFTKDLKLSDNIFNHNPQEKILGVLDTLFNDGLLQDDTKNRVVFHTLRHTFASHLAINGTPIFTIQKLMNHKTITMTMRYAKLSPDSGRESVIGLNF